MTDGGLRRAALAMDWRLVGGAALYCCQVNLIYSLQALDGTVAGYDLSSWALTLLGNLAALAVLAVLPVQGRAFAPETLIWFSCLVVLGSTAVLGGVSAGLIDGCLLWLGVLTGGIGEGAVLVLLAELFAALAPRDVLLTTGLQQVGAAALYLAFVFAPTLVMFAAVALATVAQSALFARVASEETGKIAPEGRTACARESAAITERIASPWLSSKDIRAVLGVAAFAVGVCYGAVMALVVSAPAQLAAEVAPASPEPWPMVLSGLLGGGLLVASALIQRHNPEGYLFQVAVPLLALGLASIPLLMSSVTVALPLLLSCSTYFFGILWYFVALATAGDGGRAGSVAASSFFAFLLGHLAVRALVEYGPAPCRDASLVSIALLLMVVFLLLAYISRYKHYERELVRRAEEREFEAACAAASAQFGLTERESSVLRLLALGFSAKKIADKLVVSENTAKTHVRHVYAKLDVHSRDELADVLQLPAD